MADFNPQIAPTQDPNYMRYSNPISAVEADKSKGIALAGLGDITSSVATVAKKTADDIISKDVRETVTPIRDQFTASLEAQRASIIPGAVQTPAGSTAALGFAGEENGNKPELPAAITQELNKVESIQGAYVNGKVNDTWYHGNLNSAVQKLRAKYPGFLDEIDEKVSKITGVTPANAYVADLMQDINRAATNKKTEADKVLDLARGAMTKGFDKANLMYDRLERDPGFKDSFLQWYTEENAKFTRLQYDDLQRNNFKGTKEQFVQNRKEALSGFLSDKVDSDLHATLKLSGMDQPMTRLDILQDAQANPGKYSSAQMEEFATRMQAQESIMKVQLTALTDKHKFTSDVGEEARDTAVKSATQVYGLMYDAIRKGGAGGAGLAFEIANMARGITADRNAKITSGPLGETLDNFKMVSDALGAGMSGTVIPKLLSTGIVQKLQPLFNQQTLAGRAQPDPDNPTTITEHAAKLDQLVKEKKVTPEEKAYHMKSLLNVTEDFKNKDIPDDMLANEVKYLFDPKNNTFLRTFKMDYTTTSPDGRLKVEHPGKYAAWTQMTDKSVTDRIAKLDTESKSKYGAWVDNTARELLGEDVRTLNHFTGHDNLYFEWNNTTKQLKLRDKEGALESPVGKTAAPYAGGKPVVPSDSYVKQVEQVVNRINKALPNLDHVYQSLGGGDTEVMLLNSLQRYGMDFNGKVSGLPKAIGDAIATSRKAPEKKKDE